MVSHKNNQNISCQASELLAIFPVVRHFVHAVCMPRGLCLPASQAFLARAAVIDQVHDGNQAGVISRNTLLLAIETSIEGFHTAFPAIPLIKNGIGNCTCQMPMPDLENYQVALPMRESTSPLVPWQLCCTTRKILKKLAGAGSGTRNVHLGHTRSVPRWCVPSEPNKSFQEDIADSLQHAW